MYQRKKSILIEHGVLSKNFENESSFFKFLHNLSILVFHNLSSKVIAVSNAIKKDLIKKGVSQKKITTIYNSFRKLPTTNESGLSFADWTDFSGLKLISIANLKPEKNLFSLLRAQEILQNKFNVKTKVHGTDYLPDESLQWFPKLGINAANVAPEFGTIESTALVNILNSNELDELKEKFLEMSYSSKKWIKWVSEDHTLNKNELSILGGHYIFPTDEFRDLKVQIEKNLDDDLDKYLIKSIKENIMRYLRNFNTLC